MSPYRKLVRLFKEGHSGAYTYSDGCLSFSLDVDGVEVKVICQDHNDSARAAQGFTNEGTFIQTLGRTYRTLRYKSLMKAVLPGYPEDAKFIAARLDTLLQKD